MTTIQNQLIQETVALENQTNSEFAARISYNDLNQVMWTVYVRNEPILLGIGTSEMYAFMSGIRFANSMCKVITQGCDCSESAVLDRAFNH